MSSLNLQLAFLTHVLQRFVAFFAGSYWFVAGRFWFSVVGGSWSTGEVDVEDGGSVLSVDTSSSLVGDDESLTVSVLSERAQSECDSNSSASVLSLFVDEDVVSDASSDRSVLTVGEEFEVDSDSDSMFGPIAVLDGFERNAEEALRIHILLRTPRRTVLRKQKKLGLLKEAIAKAKSRLLEKRRRSINLSRLPPEMVRECAEPTRREKQRLDNQVKLARLKVAMLFPSEHQQPPSIETESRASTRTVEAIRCLAKDVKAGPVVKRPNEAKPKKGKWKACKKALGKLCCLC
jgi:hypothetical protein